MPYRKTILATGCFYHVFTRSIAGFKIFKNKIDYKRMLEAIDYYKLIKLPVKLSVYRKNRRHYKQLTSEALIEIIAYCLMPTHIHLLLHQLKDKGISKFMNHLLISYTRYFNIRYRRKGPLWERRFKAIIVNSEDHLLHLTRYLHLNPTTEYLVEKPGQWEFSSYKEYIGQSKKRFCSFKKFLDINPKAYKKFVLARKDYQRELARIKDLILEEAYPAVQI